MLEKQFLRPVGPYEQGLRNCFSGAAKSAYFIIFATSCGRVEMVDKQDLGSCALCVWVRVPPPARKLAWLNARRFSFSGEGTSPPSVTPTPNPSPRGRGSASEEAVRACRPCRFAPKSAYRSSRWDVGQVERTKPRHFTRMSGPFLFYKQGIYRHKYPFLIIPSRRVPGMMRLTAFTTAFSFAS